MNTTIQQSSMQSHASTGTHKKNTCTNTQRAHSEHWCRGPTRTHTTTRIQTQIPHWLGHWRGHWRGPTREPDPALMRAHKPELRTLAGGYVKAFCCLRGCSACVREGCASVRASVRDWGQRGSGRDWFIARYWYGVSARHRPAGCHHSGVCVGCGRPAHYLSKYS